MDQIIDSDPKVMEKLQLVVHVLGGQMKATEAAAKMGVSRKTYYKWERRVLSAMKESLKEKDSGRPGQVVDAEKEALKQEIEELKKELLLLEQKLHIRDVLSQATDERLDRGKKG
jgi:transposase